MFGHAAERKNDLKLLEAGEQTGGKSLIPRAADADDEAEGESSDDDSDDEASPPPAHAVLSHTAVLDAQLTGRCSWIKGDNHGKP